METTASSSSEDYHSAISTVATSQICQSIGFRRAEPAAVRCLSDLLGRYLRSLATLAAAGANSHGRTNANLLDLLQAAELLHAARGFPGASDPRRPLLHSTILKDVASFVSSVDEIPFSVPLRRRRMAPRKGRRPVRSFPSDIGFEPLHTHVPRWLPMLPLKKTSAAAAVPEGRRREEALWPDGGSGGCGKANSGGHRGGDNKSLPPPPPPPLLPKERRERVRFTIGSAAQEERSLGSKGRKRVVLDRRGGYVEDEDLYTSSSAAAAAAHRNTPTTYLSIHI